ncbi:MAG: alpha/beta hydrolase [Pyrinomonadaceae bacterium]
MNIPRRYLIFVAASGFALALAALSPTNAQNSIPRLEPTQCPFERGDWARAANLECTSLIVPESRVNSKTRTIKLAVVILRAKQPDGTPPFVFLHGGPGDGAIQRLRGFVQTKAYEHHDIVLYDQRVAGYSEPKLCPEFKDIERERQKLKTQKEIEEFQELGIRKCVSPLDTRIDRSAYNTRESAADLIDLRRALGYSAWDVISDSYGARLAQEALRRDAKGMHSLVLNKPVTRGPDREAEVALFNQHAFERVFQDCTDQPGCHNAFPTLEKDFYEVYEQLKKTPLLI